MSTTWAPRGETPILERLSKRREIASVVLLTAPMDGREAQVYARHFVGTIHTAELLESLRYFRQRVGRPLWLVWDHLNVHRARAVRAFLARHPADFALTWLPGYAPELNPEEQCNQWVKCDMLHAVPDSIDDLRRLVRGRFERLQHHPELLFHFFQHAGLSVK